MKKTKLIDAEEAVIWRGNILRARGKYPYEKFVDFMVFETTNCDTPYGLIVTSGYKAGLILVNLPRESSSTDGGLDRRWVISMWSKWIYPECEVDDVYLIDRYDAMAAG